MKNSLFESYFFEIKQNNDLLEVISKNNETNKKEVAGYLRSILNIEPTVENLKDYFESNYKVTDSELNKLNLSLGGFSNISIIKEIQINEFYQGIGLGSKLLKYLFQQTNSEAYILIANVEETIWLENWYSKYGFETIFHYYSLPVMVKKNQ